ncbi:leucine-rich repeat-containing protein 2 isoform X2 [Lepisosteus oculatus]|uniref:leucine-rich repeat-containing protein 2 isoform X2 n=1 Tax=Lepisosteus oculatus TaxID=7918 RepID=UPI0007403822|nr:PREDICTED: leucine-rich repeat-containing protein 2 isoform X2 [Lepisosteus oculatus]
MGSAIVVYDLALIRELWECRVRKYKQRQKKEQERLEKSALAQLNQQWQYRLECKKRALQLSAQRGMANEFSDFQLYQEQEKKPLSYERISADSGTESDFEEKLLIFELSGEYWKEFPESLIEMTDLRVWRITRTSIHEIPVYIEHFQDLRVLELPRNCITELPAEIGKLIYLKELNLSYNKLSSIPPELGECENLEKLELIANLNLWELPFELSNLKKLIYLDLSANKFHTIPVCVLRMSGLQWFDISNNLLKELPEDIDRLQELNSFFLQKNIMTYLPNSLCNISTLSMIVVSGDHLVSMPTAICCSPKIKNCSQLHYQGFSDLSFVMRLNNF